MVKVLGMLDLMIFLSTQNLNQPLVLLVTECEIFCYTFDPFGLVTSVTITAKLLLQETCHDNVSWDTELNETNELKWASITADILVVTFLTLVHP